MEGKDQKPVQPRKVKLKKKVIEELLIQLRADQKRLLDQQFPPAAPVADEKPKGLLAGLLDFFSPPPQEVSPPNPLSCALVNVGMVGYFVGISAYVHYLLYKKYNDKLHSTIVNFSIKEFQSNETINGLRNQTMLWELSTRKNLSKTTSLFLAKLEAIVLTVRVLKNSEINTCTHLLNHVKEKLNICRESNKSALIFLMGTMIDCRNDPKKDTFSTEDIRWVAEELELAGYYECSAKDGVNINASCFEITQMTVLNVILSQTKNISRQAIDILEIGLDIARLTKSISTGTLDKLDAMLLRAKKASTYGSLPAGLAPQLSLNLNSNQSESTASSDLASDVVDVAGAADVAGANTNDTNNSVELEVIEPSNQNTGPTR